MVGRLAVNVSFCNYRVDLHYGTFLRPCMPIGMPKKEAAKMLQTFSSKVNMTKRMNVNFILISYQRYYSYQLISY